MPSKTIPQRDQVPQQYTWKLSDIYETPDAWQQDFDTLKAQIPHLAAYAGRLGESADTLYAYLEEEQEAGTRFSNLLNYAQRGSDQDTRDADFQDRVGKIMSLYVELSAALAFETPELLKLSPETWADFCTQKPELKVYDRYFDNIQRRRAHTLSDAEEALLAAAGELAQAPDDIFGKLADADLTFPDAVDSKGEKHPMSNGSYTLLMESADRTLRKSAFQSMYAAYGGMKNTLAATLSAQVKSLQFFANARRYPSALAASLDGTHVPESVYHNLIDTVHANLDKMYRYVSLRKKILGVDELHMYDVYTPIVEGFHKEIPYEEAKETVYAALAPLGEEYRAVIREALDHRWIDVYENVGKRSGGYMAGALVHPYILLNYKDDIDSMFTLAHELGHAVHSYRSNQDQPPVYREYVIFVAEVASTCNEALLMDYLLERTTDRKERAWLINHFLEQFRGTIYRQTMFAEFEREMGRRCASGETLTADLLSRSYLELNKAYFGPDMVSDPEIALEWSRIPHFYYDYYVFQYATGYAAAMALAKRIRTGGKEAVDAYLRFLSGGCSKDPIDLLKDAGVDMTSPAPVQEALDQFGALLDEMEELLK